MESMKEAVGNFMEHQIAGIHLTEFWDISKAPDGRDIFLVNAGIVGYSASKATKILEFDSTMDTKEHWESIIEPMLSTVKAMLDDGLTFSRFPKDIQREVFKRGRERMRRMAFHNPPPPEKNVRVIVSGREIEARYAKQWEETKEALRKKSLEEQEVVEAKEGE